MGGIANVVLSPLLFDRLTEYPLMLAATCLVMPPLWAGRIKAMARGWPAFFPALAMAAILFTLIESAAIWPHAGRMIAVGAMPLILAAAIAATAASRIGLVCTAAIGLVAPLYFGVGVVGTPVFHSRDFYGPLRVVALDGKQMLIHGTTMHGEQRADNPMLQTSYYAPASGIGRLIKSMIPVAADASPVQGLVIGLGAGTLACYGGDRLALSFIELDPDVLAVARRHFTFLKDCGDPPVEIGDGRLRLAARGDASLDLIVMDAFSADAVPAHLITAEAIGLALRKLRPDGAIAVHISNNYLDLAPTIAGSAAANGRIALRFNARPPEVETGSDWTVIASNPALIERLRADGWREIPPPPAGEIWRDDRWTVMNALRILRD